MSHEVINEILTLMANDVLRKLCTFVQESLYYALIIDETADSSVKEQVSISFRIVKDDFSVEELFFGFYETPLTNANTLFSIVKDVLLQFNFDIRNCRGQCYDGASNVSGVLSGVQARVKHEEPRAVYVHCMAHSSNLVV
ncbi:zinc finger MYM-type containing 1 [Chelydra serpentina]|uniref:Zinc finger MYM-type containing 1 n=1 Tax=Chelydra serpentina TaxID=8475 RepID=A0A8T1T817_CHESE|nr:zinc finger MYM-type containing 1 [Chelydra serpentina]